VRIGITEISWDGTIRRRALDTWCLADADRCEHIIGQVLTVPPAIKPPTRKTPRHSHLTPARFFRDD
jgi:hypothetical protein